MTTGAGGGTTFGVFGWISPLGHSYHRRPPPILEPLPDPVPRDQPLAPLLASDDADWEDLEIWEQPPLEPEPEPPPEHDSSDDIPPF